MWRDPLEELIEDLERAVPDPLQGLGPLFPIERMQQYTDIILYGTDEEIETLEADPAYQAWLRQMAEACGRTAVLGCPVSLRSTVQYLLLGALTEPRSPAPMKAQVLQLFWSILIQELLAEPRLRDRVSGVHGVDEASMNQRSLFHT